MLGSGLKIDLNFYDVIEPPIQYCPNSDKYALYFYTPHTHTHRGHTCFLLPTLLSTDEKKSKQIADQFFYSKRFEIKNKIM